MKPFTLIHIFKWSKLTFKGALAINVMLLGLINTSQSYAVEDPLCIELLKSFTEPNLKGLLERNEEHQRQLELCRQDGCFGDTLALEELAFYLELGKNRYITSTPQNFRDSFKSIKGAGGKDNQGVFRAAHADGPLVIKALKEYRSIFEYLNEVFNAKVIHALGFGPRTDLVNIEGEYFLVMEEVSGINIKEVLRSSWRTRQTRRRLEPMLGGPTSGLREVIQKFSSLIVNDPSYADRLSEISRALAEVGFTNIADAQFMIDTSLGSNSIQLIDVGGYQFNALAPTPTSSVYLQQSFDSIMTRLRELAE